MDRREIAGRSSDTILLPINLRDEINRSGIRKSEILKLRFYSAGLRSVEDMPSIYKSRISRVSPFGDGFRGYSLGLTNDSDAYESVSRAFSLATWSWGFMKHGLVYKTDIYTSRARMLGFDKPDTSRPADNIIEMTEKYLNIITQEGVPVCFFVPRDYSSHPSAKVTKAEIEWYIRNPKRASNTYFIFGLYSTINEGWFVDHHRIEQERRVNTLAQAFKEKI